MNNNLFDLIDKMDEKQQALQEIATDIQKWNHVATPDSYKGRKAMVENMRKLLNEIEDLGEKMENC